MLHFLPATLWGDFSAVAPDYAESRSWILYSMSSLTAYRDSRSQRDRSAVDAFGYVQNHWIQRSHWAKKLIIQRSPLSQYDGSFDRVSAHVVCNRSPRGR